MFLKTLRFLKTSLDGSAVALKFSVQVSGWLLPSIGLSSTKTLHNFFKIVKGF